MALITIQTCNYLILIRQLDNFVADNLCSLTTEEFLDAKMYNDIKIIKRLQEANDYIFL